VTGRTSISAFYAGPQAGFGRVFSRPWPMIRIRNTRRSMPLLSGRTSTVPEPVKTGLRLSHRPRGGLTTKTHVIVDALGNPLALSLTGATLTTSPKRNHWRPKSSPQPISATRDMMPTASSSALKCAHQGCHPATINPQGKTGVRLRTLRRAQSRRAILQCYQALSRYRDTLEKTRAQLPCRTALGLRTRLAQMTTGSNQAVMRLLASAYRQ
jgi:hypothetical protein